MDKLETIDFSYYDFDENVGIISKHWNRPCKGHRGKDGYIHVMLKLKNGGKKFFQYHRVMAYVFCERPEHLKDIPFDQLDVNHKNEIRWDNRASNLEWCTTQENVNYGNGNKKRSEANKKVAHTQEWNEKVRKALSKPIVQIKDDGEVVHWGGITEAHKNGFLQSAVCMCCNNKFHNEKKVKSHRRYKQSEWYFESDYMKMLGENP